MHSLWQALNSLEYEWGLFWALYCESPGRVDVLNRWSGRYFRYQQEILRRDVLLGVARILDRESTGGHGNASLRGLASLLEGRYPELAERVRRGCDELEPTAGMIRLIRNKLLAHADMEAAVGGLGDFGGLSWKDVADLLERLGDLMNDIDFSVSGEQTVFRFSRQDGRQEVLITRLESAEPKNWRGAGGRRREGE